MAKKETQVKISDQPGVVEFEDAVALTGFGWYNIRILLVSGGCLMAVIMETMSMSYVLPAAQCDFNLTLEEKGLLSAISFLGVVLSSHLWGFIGDTVGRKNVVVITTLVSFVMSLLSSLAPYVWFFILLRFLNGFFIGGASAVIYAFLGEYHDNSHRTKMISFAATFIALGTIALPVFAWLILPMQWSFYIPLLDIDFRPWRLLVILIGMPSVISALCLMQFPESPKFVWASGRSEEALTILRNLYASNTKNPKSMYPVQLLVTPKQLSQYDNDDNFKSPIRILKLMWSQTAPLFEKKLVKKTLMTSTLQFGVFASSSGMLMWLPEILNKVNNYIALNNNNPATVCTAMDYFRVNKTNTDTIPDCDDTIHEDVFIVSTAFGCLFALAYLTLGLIINLVGKKLLLIIMISGTGLAGICLNFGQGYGVIVFLSVAFLVSGTCVNLINTVVVDLFPTKYRAMAMALSLMMGRFGAVAGSNAVGMLLEYACPFTFYIFGGQHFILLVIILLLPIPLMSNLPPRTE